MKFKNISDVDIRLRGVYFPVDKAVLVDDEGLHRKVSAMPEFEQVKPGRKAKKNAEDTA